MGFWALLEVAMMPIVELLIISLLGAFLASPYCNILDTGALNSLNKIVFVVFTPALMFATLASTVTLSDIISWWFMPVNSGLTFFLGSILGWIVVKLLKPEKYMEGLVIATCSSGNMGNLMLIVVPAICNENGGPFGERSACATTGLSYASFSMALGGFYIWTYTFQLIKNSAVRHKELEIEATGTQQKADMNYNLEVSIDANRESTATTPLIQDTEQGTTVMLPKKSSSIKRTVSNLTPRLELSASGKRLAERAEGSGFWHKVVAFLEQILEELMAPPTLGAIAGLIFGATTLLRNLIVGETAPLRVIQDSIKLLGDGTIPSIILILGGNLIQGLRSAKIKANVVIGVVCVRFLILPAIGIAVVKAASYLGFLPLDPLFSFVLMLQFTVPPATNIGTMTQLFKVGEKESSVIFMWTYLVASVALTVWSTVYMWVLS